MATNSISQPVVDFVLLANQLQPVNCANLRRGNLLEILKTRVNSSLLAQFLDWLIPSDAEEEAVIAELRGLTADLQKEVGAIRVDGPLPETIDDHTYQCFYETIIEKFKHLGYLSFPAGIRYMVSRLAVKD